MIIDIHAHAFSTEVIARREHYAARDRWFGHLYADPKARLAAPEAVLASMAAAGVACSVLCGFPWADAGLCAAENDFLLEAAARSGGRLVAFVTVPPRDGTAAAREADRCLTAGARGIGELNACAQGFTFGDKALLRPLMEVAQAHNAPVLFHGSEPVGHAYPGKGKAGLQGLYRLGQNFPQNKIVLAHWGGGLIFYELMPEVRRALANVYYDTAASAFLYRPDIYAIAPFLVGVHKVLFGSDFPLLAQGWMLQQVYEQELPQDVRECILGRNAMALLGLEAKSGAEA